jgi:hypothetical protein
MTEAEQALRVVANRRVAQPFPAQKSRVKPEKNAANRLDMPELGEN